MTDLDPLWLRSFVAIAEAGTVTHAAQRVHRTQSAVSTHLQQLEATLGTQLVLRTTRSLTLTPEGEQFLPHARRLLSWQDEARAVVQPSPAAAVWRVGFSEYFLPARLGELLALLRDAAPQARFELLWSGSAALQQLWNAGQIDLAVVTSANPVPEAKLLRREPLAWVAGAGYSLPASGPAPLVLLGPDCPVRTMALASLSRSGRPHHLQLSCSGAHGAVAAIRSGWGIGCLNASAIPADLQVLSRKDARGWPSPGKLSFYALARPPLAAAERALRQWAAA
jgi:DNA-binding transcriptional LysR family regulator